jgi:hypothetical protein
MCRHPKAHDIAGTEHWKTIPALGAGFFIGFSK